MAERPEPVDDLNWDSTRARGFGERVLDLWEEFLAKLPDLPVTSREFTEQAVRDAIVIPVPDEPLSEDELVDHMHKLWFEYSMYPGHPRFSAYITAAGTVPGGVAMANFIALKAARDATAGWDVRHHGVTAGPSIAMYASEEVHVVVDRAADMLGLGTDAVRKIPVDEQYRMRADALRERIEADV